MSHKPVTGSCHIHRYWRTLFIR